jgi:glucose-6-phosphate isomerase
MKERESITVSIPEANAFNIGALIALYERGRFLRHAG